MSEIIPVEVSALVSSVDGSLVVFLETEHEADFIRVYVNNVNVHPAQPGLTIPLRPAHGRAAVLPRA